MPQLDFATYASQLFWLAICFVVLLIGSVGIYMPRLAKILDTRWQRIQGTFEEADALRKEAESLEASAERLLTEAREQAHQLATQASKQTAMEVSAKKSEAAHRFKERMRHAEILIAEKKADAMGTVQEVAEVITSDIMEKVLPGLARNDVSQFVLGAMERKRSNGR